MKRVLLSICVCAVIVGGLFFVFPRAVYEIVPEQNQQEVTPPDTTPVTLVFVGDIMLDRGVKRKVMNTMQGDYNALFANTAYLARADIAFANLEGPVANSGRNVGSKFSFRMDPVVLSAIKNAGIDVVSFANNHVGDYTKEAFDETLEHLASTQIVATGAGKNYQEVSTPDIITVRGVRVGYLAVTDVGPNWLAASEKSSGILFASDPELPKIIASADSVVDVLVVSFHWGDEYSPFNDRQELLAHSAIDNGADVV
ncbi:CapA family protein, partial [Patescibacteria group bacterium]|nr:CapA family protein [Patescibacteria group bacterium]